MKKRLFLFACAALTAGCLAAEVAEFAADPREDAEAALKNRDWAKAERLLTEVLRNAKTGQDELLLEIATAQHQAGNYDAAIATLDRVVAEVPASPLRMKALFRKGDALAAKKEFAAAGAIYDTQVAAILAPERRQKLAMVYVEAGREFLKAKDPKDLTFVANYAAAHNLLVKSLDLEALGAEEEAVRLDIITCELKGNLGRPELLKSCKTFEEKFPKSARLDESLFARGSALRDLGLPWEARKTWLRIAADVAGSKLAAEAVWSAALTHVGADGSAAGIDDLRRGLVLLRRVAKDFASSEFAPKAAYAAASALSRHESLRDEARQAFLDYATAFPKDERAPEALLQVAWLWRSDQDEAKAIAALEDLLKRFPESPSWAQARQQIADIRFERIGRAVTLKDWEAVRTRAQDFLNVHPTDARAAEAGHRIGEAFKEEKKFKEAAEAWLKNAQRHGGADFAQKSRYAAAELMVAELDDFEAAMKELAKTGGCCDGPAKGLLQKISAKSLELSSEKVFATGQAPSAKLKVRNLESIKLRTWALDLKDYFDKKGSFADLKSLEAAVIAPEKEWTHAVKDFKRYKELAIDVELPRRDPGAYIVTASAGDLEATTVVLVGDLSMIARVGRKSAAVSAPGAQVTITADGKRVKEDFGDATAARVSILADAKGHVAFRDTDLSALPAPALPEAAAILVADRQRVAAGDDVRLHLVIRDVVNGSYAVAKDGKYRLDAVSAQGVTFFEKTFSPGAAGTASVSFRIPEGLQGQVRVDVYDVTKPPGKRVGGSSFDILPRGWRGPSVDFIAGDAPVFGGDPIDVTLVLRDAWGRPMPGRKLQLRTSSDLEPKDVMTGADGTVAVSVKETEAFLGQGRFRIDVEGQGLRDAWSVPVLSRLPILVIDAASRFEEPAFAGEAKTFAFTAKRADGTNLADTFSYLVHRFNDAGERTLLGSGSVATAADGKGSFAFTPKEGGRHQVTLLKKDADGLPVSGTWSIAVIDDKHPQKLFLRSTETEFEPGTAMKFTILSRLEKATAFVTVEGEKITQKLEVALGAGSTAVELAAPPASLQSFTVSVSAVQDGKLHSDVRHFAIKRPELAFEPGSDKVKSGDEAVIKVRTRPGREVLLLAAEYAGGTLPLERFQPRRPQPFFTTASSAGTTFAWETRQIDPQVLAALARLDDLQRESPRVMLERPDQDLFENKRAQELEEGQDAIGGRFGGQQHLTGRGGGYGGRYGGQARGGNKGRQDLSRAESAPLAFLTATADASGIATFRFRVPPTLGDYTLKAWGVGAANDIAFATTELKARTPVAVVLRLPESAVEGEKTSAVALLTNATAQEQDVAINDVKIKVPARSTVEKTFEWTAAASATFTVDGQRRDLEVRLRLKAPAVVAEKGGAFTAKADLDVEGEGPVFLRIATSPEAFLESLGEGDDDFSAASDASARLIARVARHRRSPTDATRNAVLEFAALRAAGLRDIMDPDLAGPVLLYLAAAEAKAAEFDIAPDGAALKTLFAQAQHDDAKALMLFALSRGKEAQQGYLHRLWRSADTLSPRATACVALAFKALGKTDEAKAGIARLLKSAKDDHWDAVEVPLADRSNTGYATTALAALALAEIDPAEALLPKVRAWLLNRTPSSPFERAILALAMQSTPDKAGVTQVKVGERAISGFGDVVAARATLEPTGAGSFYAIARRATAKVPESPVKAERRVRWPSPVVEGEHVFASPAAVEEPVKNPSMARVAAGESFIISWELTLAGPTTRTHVVEFPAMTGLRLLNSPPRFLVPPSPLKEIKQTVSVLAYADAPGSTGGLEVLAAGSSYREGWKPDHAERLAMGRLQFNAKKWNEARATLTPLFEQGQLLDPAAVEAARMIAYASIEVKALDTVVKYFELLKEKSPAEVVPFDKIRSVGSAYRAAGEHERGMQVFAGTCDAYFLQESNVIGALEELGRLRPAAEWTRRLLAEHPDTQLTREMLFGFGQRLYSRSLSHVDPVEKDPRSLSRMELLAESTAALERYLLWYPSEPDGDKVSLTLGSAYLEAGKFPAAERTGRDAAARAPKSRLVDSFDYTQAFAQFAQRKYTEALALCDRLETFDYGRNANPGATVMWSRAVLMKAQIFHAKGELEKAAENYRKIRTASADAARSLAYLEREAISIPELSVLPLAKPAEIEFEYAGVAQAALRAYKVDLTTLTIRRKGLADAADIEVAGFKPVFERTVPLDHPNARRREKQKLVLDLKEPGAYLVGVKAGDFFASGLVLRSDLTMTVQEEAGGTVRVNVASAASGAFVEGVKVTMLGMANQKIASDRTDLRGVCEVGGISGMAVVVAEKDGHAAIYRGQRALGLAQRPYDMPAAKEQQTDELKKQVSGENDQYEKNWSENIRRQQKGVEVERTKK